jgi:hypothetical protein
LKLKKRLENDVISEKPEEEEDEEDYDNEK